MLFFENSNQNQMRCNERKQNKIKFTFRTTLWSLLLLLLFAQAISMLLVLFFARFAASSRLLKGKKKKKKRNMKAHEWFGLCRLLFLHYHISLMQLPDDDECIFHFHLVFYCRVLLFADLSSSDSSSAIVVVASSL